MIYFGQQKKKKIPKPTMVVNSGGGLHIYWRIKKCTLWGIKYMART